ncbi:ribitol-5-phosphate xylosyltransferase 1-like [Mytilus trossulus]|uniref:ribitol-5-phosphate xylosyltransferase 1-like n=1 Tax=Mytilus trossulus TaxID=6551 RepID=UPI003006B7B6
MRWNCKLVAFLILVTYFLVSFYTGYLLVIHRLEKSSYELQRIRALTEITEDDDNGWNPWGEEFEKEGSYMHRHKAPKILWNKEDIKSEKASNNSTHIVDIWSIAAIGHYLWEHILGGKTKFSTSNTWSHGEKKIDNIEFRYKVGPAVTLHEVPQDVKNLVLVLNGREVSKIKGAREWLNYLPLLKDLQHVAVVLLGNEQCNNDWIKHYMKVNGGRIDFVFLVYDSPDIDNRNFYQWPLGVATYRDFPNIERSEVPIYNKRKFVCNFMGTIYKNSSREVLLDVLRTEPLRSICSVKARQTWLPQETDKSREDYIDALEDSDITLNPVGQNTECYRIYEALALGSLPVVEDVMTPGNCGKSSVSDNVPLRILKEYKAPVKYIKDWKELRSVLSNELKLSIEGKIKRRKELMLWYENFKSKLREHFIHVVQEKFFSLNQ